jgi:hypothetical protein
MVLTNTSIYYKLVKANRIVDHRESPADPAMRFSGNHNGTMILISF